ncbi:MAG: flagellin [Acetobacteraceae bacterium]|nr:flagellin [Acetobacteraceae bacterium]
MSGGITSTSIGDYGQLTQLIADNAKVHNNLDTLTEQASSGRIADTYAGLGDGAAMSLNLNPHVAQLQTWQANIDAATGQMQVTQTAMTQLQQIATDFVAQTNNLNGLGASEIDSIASDARDALSQVTNLLDTQYGNTHVFAGQDTGNPPVPSPDAITTAGFFTQIQTAVSQLSTLGGAAVVASTLATASSNTAGTSPFSTYLSAPVAGLQAPAVQIGANQTVTIGLFASGNSLVASTGTSTTGSYMRDLMRALATIGSLSSSQANDPGLATVVDDTRTSLTNALTAMASEAGVLGNRQTSLATTKTQLTDTATALTGTIGNAEDVDMASTLSKLSSVQTQLQASYQLIAGVSALSLVKFLPAG